MGNTQSIVILFMIMGAILFGSVMIQRWRVQRTFRQIVEKFRRLDSNHPSRPRTLDELGFHLPRGMFQSFLKGRDYQGRVLVTLIQQGIVQQATDGKYYLVEEKLRIKQ